MTIWKNCRADIYYADEGAELNDPGYEVRVTNGDMVISYQGQSGWVNYSGQDQGGGHYLLHCPEVDGRAMMHHAPESSIIEGYWSEDGCDGMWRLYLID